MGRDAAVARAMLAEIGIAAQLRLAGRAAREPARRARASSSRPRRPCATSISSRLSAWIEAQPEWSDLPFVLLTHRGGGLERNPTAARYLEILGNVTFLERPFHPTTLVSVARSALRGRRRQYEARGRLDALHESERQFRTLAEFDPEPVLDRAARRPHLLVQPPMVRLYRHAPDAVEGWGWQSVLDPEQLPEMLRRWRVSLDTGTPFEMV